jgi:flagellar biosynthetic protein FliR
VTEALLALHEAALPILMAHLAAFLRIGALVLLAPGLGDRMIPARIRLMGAFALTAATAPAIPPPPQIGAALILTEGAIGLALGAALRFVAAALTMAGMMAAQLTSLSHLFGTGEPSSSIGNLLNMAGLALIMASGLPVWLVDCLIRSYDVLPMGAVMPGPDAVRWGVGRMAHAFALAFALAAPFALAALLYNLAMGVINRAMPQLMVVLVGAPLITGAAGVVLLLAAPLMLSVWREAMLGVLADPVAGAAR